MVIEAIRCSLQQEASKEEVVGPFTIRIDENRIHAQKRMLYAEAALLTNDQLVDLGPYIPPWLAIWSVLGFAKAIIELRLIPLCSRHHMQLRED